jgi:hypothetical protein
VQPSARSFGRYTRPLSRMTSGGNEHTKSISCIYVLGLLSTVESLRACAFLPGPFLLAAASEWLFSLGDLDSN